MQNLLESSLSAFTIKSFGMCHLGNSVLNRKPMKDEIAEKSTVREKMSGIDEGRKNNGFPPVFSG
jgi:hypothetical protein